MYGLVFFIKSKTISIVGVEEMYPEKDEGEVTFVKYGKSKYKAKIVKKSEDKDYLSCLKVTKEGEILQKNVNVSSKLAQNIKENLKKKGKAISQKKAENLKSQNQELLNMKTVFEDSESDSEEESEKSSEESDDEPAKKIQKLQERIKQLERERKRAGASREGSPSPSVSTLNNAPMVSQQENGSPDFQPARNHSSAIPRTQRQDLQNLDVPPVILVPEVEENRNNEDPLLLYQRPGEGRITLCPSYNVYIDKGDLTYIQRWKKNPKEMTRQLLKNLVGVNNLKNMCARGRSKTKKAIPKEIMNSVEYYVNKKCETKLTPAEFTDVVNLLIGTLRNPKDKN